MGRFIRELFRTLDVAAVMVQAMFWGYIFLAGDSMSEPTQLVSLIFLVASIYVPVRLLIRSISYGN